MARNSCAHWATGSPEPGRSRGRTAGSMGRRAHGGIRAPDRQYAPRAGVRLPHLAWTSGGAIGRGDRVVVVSTANGLKFPEFKQRYHEGTLPMAADWANRPVEVANDYDAVRRALGRLA